MQNISIGLYGKEFDITFEGGVCLCKDFAPYGEGKAEVEYLDDNLKIIEISGENGEIEITNDDPFIEHVHEKLVETLLDK